ncbi:MAG: hypothetical protein J6J42_07935 [Lachnospiraceae bacterium]|nr:hypothetical protein [Lachnospiraceae bacterium]
MGGQNNIQTNRQYKDRLFRLIFGSEKNKKYILDLYNALNDTNYTDDSLLEITTIQDVVYMGMKNDSSFIIDSELNLFEQQSSYNPNMPFREFEYCAKLLDKWVEENNFDIYGSRLVKLPTPKCYVFYNGMEEHEDKEILKLSDAFITESEGCEWTVTMLNINKGHNLELMNKCGVLKEYSEFVAMVRDSSQRMNIQQAVEQTVVTFIERNGLLSGFLKSHRAEVVDVCITEYKEELHLKNVHNEGRAEGRAEGEARMSKLVSVLINQQKFEELKKVTTDEAFREECYTLYNI